MTDREVMQQALEALERYQVKRQDFDRFADEITALRAALEQQAEPICPSCKAKVLFECVACSSNNYPTQQQAEPPPEWPLIKNILDEYGLDAIAFVADWKAAQQQAEPVAYFDFQELKFTWAKHMKIGPVPVSIKVDPMKLYSEAAQRQWVGLTDDDFLEACQIAERGNYLVAFQRIQIKLKERNA